MTMARVNNKTKGFNSVPRDVVYDNDLSDRARFLYIYMACKPEGWEFYQDAMAKELGYGKDTLRKYLDELIKAGWVTEEKQQHDDNGKFGALQYTIEIVRNRKGNNPIREITDTEKYRNGKIPNHKDIENNNSTINSPLIKRNIENIEKKNKTKVLSKKAAEPVLLTDEEVRFNAHMQECYPYVQKMNEPLTYAQYMRLHNEFDYTFEQLEDILSKMDNYPNLLKCGRIAYRTALNWLRREYKETNKIVI